MKYFNFLFCLMLASVLRAQEAPIRLGDAGSTVPIIARADNGDLHVLWLNQTNTLIHSKRTAGSASFEIIDSLVPVAGNDTIKKLLCCAVRNDTVFMLCEWTFSEYHNPMDYWSVARFHLVSMSNGASMLSPIWSSDLISTSTSDGYSNAYGTDYFIKTFGQNVVAGFSVLGDASPLPGFREFSVIVLRIDEANHLNINLKMPVHFQDSERFENHVSVVDSAICLLTLTDTLQTDGVARMTFKRYGFDGSLIDSMATVGFVVDGYYKSHRYKVLNSTKDEVDLLWTPTTGRFIIRSRFSATGRTDLDTLIHDFDQSDMVEDLKFIPRNDGNSLLLWFAIDYKKSNYLIRYRMLDSQDDTLGHPRTMDAVFDINALHYRSAVGLDKQFGFCWAEPGGVYYQELSDEFITAAEKGDIALFASTPELSVHPNPLHDRGIIRYTTPVASSVQILLFDALGRHVKTYAGTNQSPGIHSIELDVSDLPAGMYQIALMNGNIRVGKNLVVVK
jgi:hypothetical protein